MRSNVSNADALHAAGSPVMKGRRFRFFTTFSTCFHAGVTLQATPIMPTQGYVGVYPVGVMLYFQTHLPIGTVL